MFNKLGIRGKLLFLCVVLASFNITIGTGALYDINKIVKEYSDVTDGNLPDVQTLEEWNSSYRRARIYTGLLGNAEVTAKDAEEYVKRIRDSVKKADAAEKLYSDTPFADGEKDIYDPLHTEWMLFKGIVDHALDAFAKQDRKTFTNAYLAEMHDSSERFEPQMDKLLAFVDADAKKNKDEAIEAATMGRKLALLQMAFGFVIAMTLGFFFSRSLSRTLSQIADTLSSDADEVAAAADQIAASSEELSSSVTETAAALQETAASIEEMSAMITKNTESAAKSKDLSDQSQNSATEGKRIVDDMIRAIGEIHTSNTEMTTEIEKSNQEISDIIKVIGEIGNKTKVINDIVFQTKLLSFNASVEAARAGEHGKGFAVVAEEVGNLAQMSGNASKEISSMLEGSIAKVESIVNNTKTKVERLVATGKEKVETGNAIAKRCGEVLDTIVTNVSTVNLTVNEISTASQEQDHGVKEVAKAMSQMDQATQQNSASTQETAGAAEKLATQAASLRQAVIELMTTVQGAGAVTETHLSSKAPSAAKPAVHTSPSVVPKNVVAMKRPEKTTPPKKEKRATERSVASAGAEDIPSSNDPRFEDVG